MRVFAVSDLHVDYPVNREWVNQLSHRDYCNDALIVAGDVTHDLTRLAKTFEVLLGKFSYLAFVPGNHELWTLGFEGGDSLDKFREITTLSQRMGVITRPQRLGSGESAIWLVPLYSWYLQPEESEDSLFVNKPGEDPSLESWSDRYFVKWPNSLNQPAADYFLQLNQPALTKVYHHPVISFSHFLPRRDLIFGERRERQGKPVLGDPHRSFNFSRVAGDARIDHQIRTLGSQIHVYGHQHRNRHREVDGVTYVSHCLGYVRERSQGYVKGLERGPKCIWDNAPAGFQNRSLVGGRHE